MAWPEDIPPSAPFKVSVIIPDTDSLLIGTIVERLCAQISDPEQVEILVVGSDHARLVCEDSRIIFLPLPSTACASDKRNHGMSNARGDLLLFLDDDCLPTPDLLARHLARHQQGEWVVGGAVTFPSDHYIQLADNISAFHDLLPFTQAGERAYLCTANLSVRRQVVDHAGLMEPRKNRAEDLEWTVRFRSLGYRLYFEPTALIVHCPARFSLTSVWHHWIYDAPHTLQIRLRYTHLLQTPALVQFRWAFFWLAPVIAAWATWRTFAHLRTRVLYWHTVPLVYMTKLAWCWGAYIYFPDWETKKGRTCYGSI
jgi:glycosyltransferase involved in cell wall biosynthesis